MTMHQTPLLIDVSMERDRRGRAAVAGRRSASWPRTPDILPLGMLADALRRRLHGTRVTFLRVAACAFDQSIADAVPAGGARGPAHRLARVARRGRRRRARRRRASPALARSPAFSWADVERWRAADGHAACSTQLREAGLDALAELPLDTIERSAHGAATR